MRIIIILIIGFLFAQDTSDDWLEKLLEQDEKYRQERKMQELEFKINQIENEAEYQKMQENDVNLKAGAVNALSEYFDNQLKMQSTFASPSKSGQFIKVTDETGATYLKYYSASELIKGVAIRPAPGKTLKETQAELDAKYTKELNKRIEENRRMTALTNVFYDCGNVILYGSIFALFLFMLVP